MGLKVSNGNVFGALIQGRKQDFGKGGGGGVLITINYYLKCGAFVCISAMFVSLFMKFQGLPIEPPSWISPLLIDKIICVRSSH